MKLIFAIIRDELCEQILQTLIQEDFRATQIASTGGFLRRGLTTLMIGVEDEKVDQAIQAIGDQCTPTSAPDHRCATVFVLNVDQFLQV